MSQQLDFPPIATCEDTPLSLTMTQQVEETKKGIDSKLEAGFEMDGVFHHPNCDLHRKATEYNKCSKALNAKKRKREEKQSANTDTKKKPKAKTSGTHKFGSWVCKSMKKGLDYCKHLLGGDKIEFCPGDADFDILCDIFRRLDAYKTMEMKLVGIKKNEKGKGTNTFFFVTKDNKTFSVNYRDCLRLSPPPVKTECGYKVAFENAIKPALTKYRRKFFKNQPAASSSAPSGQTLNKKTSQVVYLGKSFDTLVAEFLAQEGKTPEDFASGSTTLMVESSLPGKIGINDPILKAKWITFHEEHAKLDIVAKRTQSKEKKKMNTEVPPMDTIPTSVLTGVLSPPGSSPQIPLPVASAPEKGMVAMPKSSPEAEMAPQATPSTTFLPNFNTQQVTNATRLCAKISLPVHEQSFQVKDL